MTEKEKLQKGLIYNPNYDEELQNEIKNTQDLCFEYNNTQPSDINKKMEILQKLNIKMGKRCTIEQDFWCDYGYNIELGENFYSNHNLVILDAAKVSIGNDVFIGPNCSIYTSGHPLNAVERNEGLEYAKPISIGNNVWIGGNVVILPGVKVGNNVVIGAGSVVTKDIPDNCVAVGNPCKVIKDLQ